MIAAGEKQRQDAKAVPHDQDMKGAITHTWLWPRVGKFFKEHGKCRLSAAREARSLPSADLILAETGTSAFGIVNVPFPSTANCVVQTLWGKQLRGPTWRRLTVVSQVPSVGLLVPHSASRYVPLLELHVLVLIWDVLACRQGTQGSWSNDSIHRYVHLPERERPLTNAMTGEGSLQMSIQEVGTMIKKGVTPYLFVINNDGYVLPCVVDDLTNAGNAGTRLSDRSTASRRSTTISRCTTISKCCPFSWAERR